jgi:rhodanese-related sulfurtransferase
MSEIDVQTLKKWRDEHTEHQLIDVREPWEVEIGKINGLHIPMDRFLDSIDKINTDIPVVIHCRSGSRSAAVAHHLTKQLGYENIHNLIGGIQAWSNEIDSNIDVA